MAKQAKQTGAAVPDLRPFLDLSGARRKAATLSASTVDASNSPTTQIRRGQIMGADSNTGLFIDQSDASVDAHELAAVTSAGDVGAGWQNETLSISVEGQGTIVHAVGGSITGVAGLVAEIKASAAGAFVTPSASSDKIVLTAIRPGSRLEVSSSLDAAYGAGVTASDDAALTEYGLLLDPVFSMLDQAGAAEEQNVTLITANATISLAALPEAPTIAARTYFERNGIILKANQ